MHPCKRRMQVKLPLSVTSKVISKDFAIKTWIIYNYGYANFLLSPDFEPDFISIDIHAINLISSPVLQRLLLK